MDRFLLAGLQILSVLSVTTHTSSSRPHIIFILADDLVSMILISFYLYVREGIRVYIMHFSRFMQKVLFINYIFFQLSSSAAVIFFRGGQGGKSPFSLLSEPISPSSLLFPPISSSAQLF